MSAPLQSTASLSAGRREWLVLITLALLWSSSFMMIKVGIQSIGPLSLATGRLLIGAAALAIVAAWRQDPWPKEGRDWLGALAVGLFGNALPFSLINWGEIRVDSGLAAILIGAMPIGVVLLAHFLTHDEPMTRRRMAGVLTGFSGLVVLVGWDALSGLGAAAWAQIAILGAAMSYAVTTVIVRRFVRSRGCGMAAAATLCGTLLLMPLTLWLEPLGSASPSVESLLAMLGLGLLPTALATMLYFNVLGRIGANVFAQVNYVVPLLGVGWGVLLLGEQPGLQEAIALGLILSGVLIVNREARG